MIEINYLAIVVATVLAFLFSAGFYVLLNKQVMALRGVKPDKDGKFKMAMTPNKIMAELVRTFVLGLVMSYAVALLGIVYFNQAVLLALWLWIGFPVVLLVGSVMHENFPPRLAAIHAGDWLVKLMIFAVILTLWR
jgi:hypothetical protein